MAAAGFKIPRDTSLESIIEEAERVLRKENLHSHVPEMHDRLKKAKDRQEAEGIISLFLD